MTANFTLYSVDADWLSENPNATFEDVSDDALLESIDLEQASLELVFERRSDAANYIANGEFGPGGGLAEWDGADCYMGFISPAATAQIAQILSTATAEELLQVATWIDDDLRDEISHCFRISYPDIKQFVEKAAKGGHGLACLFVE